VDSRISHAALTLVEPDLARAMWADGADDRRVGYELARAAGQSVLVAVALASEERSARLAQA
jgi:hypothetical protein